MDPRLLRYYNQELRYLREMGGEFAKEFPKVAGRLGMEGMEVADPYVERLVEGCAFLAARVQLKQDAEYPQLAQRLLEMISPNLTAPIPSMLVARMMPAKDPNLINGFRIARGSALTGPATALSRTRCEFRTAQDVVLTPMKVVAAEYFLSAADLPLSTLPIAERPRSGARIKLELPAGLSFSQLKLGSVRFFLGGLSDVALRLHELIGGATLGVLAGPPGRGADAGRLFIEAGAVRPIGYSDEEAMLPVTLRGLAGTRLVQEYFAFPQRFLFFDVSGLGPALAKTTGNQFEIAILFDRFVSSLEGAVEADNFQLHCVPAINLFERRADRLHLDEGSNAYHLVPERTAALDYEVFDVTGVTRPARRQRGAGLPAAVRCAAVGAGQPRGRYSARGASRACPRTAASAKVPAPATSRPKSSCRWSMRARRRFAARPAPARRDHALHQPRPAAVHAHWAVGHRADARIGRAGRLHHHLRRTVPAAKRHARRRHRLAAARAAVAQLPVAGRQHADTRAPRPCARSSPCSPHGAERGLKRQIEGVRSVRVKPVVRRHPAPGPDRLQPRPRGPADGRRPLLRGRQLGTAVLGAAPLFQPPRVDEQLRADGGHRRSAAATS